VYCQLISQSNATLACPGGFSQNPTGDGGDSITTVHLDVDATCYKKVAWAWVQVAYINGPATADGSGDSESFSVLGSKMSDDYINQLQFSMVKFEPVDENNPITYFNFNGRAFASETAVPCSEYALTESDALMGQWSKDSCAAFDVCNFGRGHCDYTVKSAFGWANYGGCGNGPIIGTSGIKSGDVRIYVNHMGSLPTTTTLTSITSTLTSTLTSTTAPAMAAVGLVESVGETPVNNLAIALEVLAGLLLMCGAVLLARYHCPHQKPQKEPVIQGSRFVGVFGRLRSQHVLDKTKDPAWAAISLRQLDELRVGAKSALGDKYATSNMHDVNREVIQPICNEHHKCYAHFANAEELLKVNVFVSHAWLENFDMFVDAVNSAFQNWTGKPNIWVCATALIQSTDPSVVALQVGTGDDPSEAPFTKALCQADKLLVVRNDVCDLYDRIWCCWELYYAYEQGLVHRPGALMVVGPSPQCDAYKHVDVATAQASNMDDKRKILSHILQSAERYSDINKALTEVKFFGASEIDQRV